MGPNPILDRFVRGPWLFVIGFVLFCSVYEYGRVLNSPPFPHHLDRQTVGLSMAYDFWEKGKGILDPQVHHLFADDLSSGRTVGEFPVLNYAIALVWRATGPGEFVFRLFMLLLHFAASYALFRMYRRLLDHNGWATMAALFFFTSPAIVYFAIGFMPDVPAFDLVLLGSYGLMRNLPAPRSIVVVQSVFLFTMAALMKITALMVPLALMTVALAEVVRPGTFAKGGGLFKNRKFVLGSLLLMLIIVFLWYTWAAWYNELHGFRFSHSGTWALWDLPKVDAARVWNSGGSVTIFQLFDTPAWIALGGMSLFILVYARTIPSGIWLAMATLFFGIVLYTLLWFIALDGHEYYFIHPMVLPIMLAGSFLYVLKQRFPRVFASVYARAAFLLLLMYHLAYAANNHAMRTRGIGNLEVDRYLPLFHPAEVEFWNLAQYWTLTPALSIEPYNRSIGILPGDKVMCLTDRTVCGSLYLMRQRGWTRWGAKDIDPGFMDERIRKGAKYLFLYDGEWPASSALAPYIQHQIGEYRGLRVYDLRDVDLGGKP